MKITREADYAIRIVHCLCKREDRVDAKAIAQETDVTLRFTLKILRKLCQEGIAKSYKGVSGGYVLNKQPEAITLLQVVEAVDGPIRINKCLAKGYVCGRVSKLTDCTFHSALGKINTMLRRELDAVNFASFNSEA